MRWRETLTQARRNLAGHRLRSALSMLGMVFGVGAVIAMLSIGGGAQRQALEMIDRLGVRNVIVRARDLKAEEIDEIRKRSPGVAWRDAEAIVATVPGVEEVVERVALEPYKVLAANARATARVWGVSHRQASLLGTRLAEGRFLDVSDERELAQVCVLGSAVRRELFGIGPAVGEHVKVDDLWLVVVGVLGSEAKGGSSFGGVALGDPAREILLPVTTVQRKLERPASAAPIDEIVVALRDGVSPIQAAASIRPLIDRLHAGAHDWELVVPEALLEESRRTQRLFNLVMGCIAGISLLVGGIGIMNIMLAAVLERTREIGLRRAVGARQREIRDQFVMEASLISLAGGGAGIVFGVTIAKIVAVSAGWPTVVTALSIVVSCGVSVTVGLAAGIYPAVRAARLNPIEALRHE
ncbi:MAG TPA: ABC transporter permease [Thermoanaerobaculaceae bacterium]|nr:ABC transporter permease [Thermoanaerobaculaceae bacterium]HRS16964.1 ABC transporter permease [Thermoanaerobaculaceae bacterium]